jgi:hypothetical protein
MGMGGTIAKGVGGLLAVALFGGGGAVLWASSARDAVMAKTWEIAPADFPVPFPLTEDEVAALRAEKAATLKPPTLPDGTPVLPVDAAGELLPPPDPLAGVDLEAVALERAVARGKHLMFSRLGCPECHGENLAGGVMIDAPEAPGRSAPEEGADRGQRRGVDGDGRRLGVRRHDPHVVANGAVQVRVVENWPRRRVSLRGQFRIHRRPPCRLLRVVVLGVHRVMAAHRAAASKAAKAA